MFSAVPGPGLMGRIWIRDNYWIYTACPQYRNRIFFGFESIVRKHEDKIIAAIESPPEFDYEHIHPVYNKDLTEIAEPWANLQNDSVGNLLEVLSLGNSKYSKLIYDYLMAIEYWKCPDYGFWEETKEIHPSSIAACIRGIYTYDEYKDTKTAQKAMLKALPRVDLATLSLLYPSQLVNKGVKHRILSDVYKLEGEWGVKRYVGDKWTGESRTAETEPEWPLGFCFLYNITKEPEYLQKLDAIHDKFGYIPELMIDGKPGCNIPLNWAEFMYRNLKFI